MPENIPAKLHKIGIRERTPEGIITDEENRERNYDEEVISMTDQEFVPVPINPIDLMLGNDVEPISSSELNDLEIFGKGSENHINGGDRSDTHVTQRPATIQLEHIPGELSDVTMSMDDNGTESVESNLGGNIPSGADDRADMSSGEDDRAEEDEVNEEEEDHDLRSDDIEKTSRFPSHNHNLRPRKPRSYASLFVQMGFKAGVKQFGARAEDAVRTEFRQRNDYDCLTPRSDLNSTEKRRALEYLMMIQKREMDG